MSDMRDRILTGAEAQLIQELAGLTTLLMGESPWEPHCEREVNERFTRLVKLARFRRDFSTGGAVGCDPKTLADVVDYLTKS